ncbi:MAG TPA: ParB/RepB/Spo0J family partition protein [Spirochaetia bacterium]|nr:ParB/RepB/Spo0J family partition protein [Spirochaetia bacterium]
MSRKALGKGIGALLGEDAVSATLPSTEVALASLVPNPHQPRQAFSEESLRELADSIREKGILQPILVEAQGNGGYMIVAGERRVRAARLVGLQKIPVVVREFTAQEKLEIALIENIQREDLSPIEAAQAYKRLMELANLNQEELAQRLGKERSTVANTVRLLKLPAEAQAAVGAGAISAGHARALLTLVNPSDVAVLLKRIQDDDLTVRDAEAAAGALNQGRKGAAKKSGRPRGARSAAEPHVRELEERLIEKFGTKVVLKGSARQGRIEISYFSAEELERLLQLLT